MGAWSHESFGNDDACDWSGQLANHDDLGYVESTFDELLAAGADYLESDTSWAAIAAAETVARLKGNFGKRDAYSRDVDAWVERVGLQPSAGLVDKACRALDRIMTAPSELIELCDDADEPSAWRAAMEELRQRVAG